MRIILKIFAVLLAAILSVVVFAMDQLVKVYSLVAGWFFLLLALCAVMAVIGQNWTGLAILGGMFVAAILVFLLVAIATGFIEDLRDRLKSF